MLRILLAAASNDSLSLFAAALAAEPEVRVAWAESGADALEKAAREAPELVVVTEELGDMAGLVLVRRLLAVSAAINTAVISARPAEEFHQAGEGLGIMAQLPPRPGKEEAEMILGRLKSATAFPTAAAATGPRDPAESNLGARGRIRQRDHVRP